MLRVWNLSLLVATFSLTILGTFLTRSGVIESVHAFGDGPVGAWFLAFFGLIVVVSLGLIAWRGDRLRSPGAIDSPLSREGAFLANNVCSPCSPSSSCWARSSRLLVEALDDRRTIVGAPYFDRLTMPIGLVLLFLMGVAPVLPWRKASQELLRKRLFWPAWIGAASLVLAVMVGATGWAPLVAFGMAGFAAGAALRQLALATRRQGWRGFVGRANGGMIVHLGVIMIAVALASSNSFTHATRLQLEQGVEQEWQGHTFRLESVRENVNDAGSESALEARVLLDDSKVIVPAITTYLNMGIDVPTPGVRTGLTNDVYLTLEQGAQPGDTSVSIQAFIRPMILWLWIGGLVMALGTLLSAFPGSKRRRATDPVSAPIPHGSSLLQRPPMASRNLNLLGHRHD